MDLSAKVSHYLPTISISASLIVCVIIVILLSRRVAVEHLTNANGERYVQLYDGDIFTPLYAAMSDTVFRDEDKEEYEASLIASSAGIGPDSKVLDVGCGTGHRTAQLAKFKCSVVGIDPAANIIARAKTHYPSIMFLVDNILNPHKTPWRGTYTHVNLLNFGVYKEQDTGRLFRSIHGLLAPHGKMVLHLVNRQKFDPIVPAASVFLGIAPQNYSSDRITRSRVVFDTHEYTSNLEIPRKGDKYTFVETITPKDGGTIIQNRTALHMPKQGVILAQAADMGFKMVSQRSLDDIGYKHNYIYILQKRD